MVHLPRWLRALVLSRRSAVAFKTGSAAGLAWFLGAQLPQPMGDYAYYASLGAVSVIYPALSDSLKHAVRATAAIMTGAVLASLMQVLTWPNALSVAVVILLASAVSNLPVFGVQRHWVLTASLFVLVFSGNPPMAYVLVYTGQILTGALVGLAINYVAFPSTNLTSLSKACEQLRSELVVQLNRMSVILRSDATPDPREFHTAFAELELDRDFLHTAVDDTRRSGRGNPRARWLVQSKAELVRRAEGLERVAFLIQDVGAVLREFQDSRYQVLDGPLREATASAFENLSVLLKDPTPEGVSEVEASVQGLMDRVDATTFDTPQGRYLAGLIAISARRCLNTVSILMTVRDPAPGPSPADRDAGTAADNVR